MAKIPSIPDPGPGSESLRESLEAVIQLLRGLGIDGADDLAALQFKSSKLVANRGYIELQNNFKIQWGKSGELSSGGSEVIIFPKAFTDWNQVIVSSTYRNDHNVSTGTGGVDSVLKQKFTVYAQTGATNKARWVAFGK